MKDKLQDERFRAKNFITVKGHGRIPQWLVLTKDGKCKMYGPAATRIAADHGGKVYNIGRHE